MNAMFTITTGLVQAIAAIGAYSFFKTRYTASRRCGADVSETLFDGTYCHTENGSRASEADLKCRLDAWCGDHGICIRHRNIRTRAKADRIMALLMSEAQKGAPEKMCQLADAYRTGLCGYVEQDMDEAFRWYSEAADRGDAEAMYRTAFCLVNGIGTEACHERAFELALKATELDARPRNLGFLAMFYELGLGTAKNIYEARKCRSGAIKTKNKAERDDEAAATLSAKKLAESYGDPESPLYDLNEAGILREIYGNFRRIYGFERLQGEM